MALGSWTWTPGRRDRGAEGRPRARRRAPRPGETWAATAERFAAWAPPGLGALGLAEQTGVIEEPLAPGSATVPWRVVGPGEARWLADPEGGETIVARSGEVISTPVIPL